MPHDEPGPTGHAATVATEDLTQTPDVRRFRLTVVAGPASGCTWESQGERCSLGSQVGNDFVLADPTVSRFHCEILLEGKRVRVVDLDSKNGTFVDGVQVANGFLRAGSELRMGATAVRFELADGVHRIALSSGNAFGTMVGRSVAMRAAFAHLEKAAKSDATVLLEGETGTGKGEAAESIHRESRRASGPFVVVDCSAIPETLLESELFGHERGAFTGATQRRIGTFEEASGGTVFLDEIGELPLNLQPKLLRVLENRALRRVGGTAAQKVDVRIVAATNRDLRAEVNAGRFRADLYYRLGVLRMTLPPLRLRPDDLPDLCAAILARLEPGGDTARLLEAPGFLPQLARASWPGNVRELRNYLERCLVYDDVLPPGDELVDPIARTTTDSTPPPRPSTPRLPFSRAREEAISAFERAYLEDLMREHAGRMNVAAAAAGIGRVYLYKLLTRHRAK